MTNKVVPPVIKATEDKEKTIGTLSMEVAAKATHAENAMELAGDMLSDYDKNVLTAIEDGIKKFPKQDFYVVVLSKREKLMPNVMRNFFLTRESCPTPANDQAVFRYDHKKEEPEFLWIVPDTQTCFTYVHNKELVDTAEYGLLQNILDYNNGTLFIKALTLNGEKFK